MKIKSAIVMLTAVFLLVGITASAKQTGPKLDAPTGLAVAFVDGSIEFDWDDNVTGADKYSVAIEGVVWYIDEDGDAGEPLLVMMEIEVSLGTSDWNEDMSESALTITIEELAEVVALQLGLAAEDTLLALTGPLVDAVPTFAAAKVKALDPSEKTGNKRQNNPFSDPADFPDYVFFGSP
ncbi:MAG: hypothetical protein JSW66_14670 [Phycisphaerales bacterium]|nr:MAG: hypothetical protein JSW66_14670 [Phycisphaerales bacterium]